MYSQMNCPICDAYLGKAHGYQHNAIISYHIRQEHPAIYRQVAEAVKEIKALQAKIHSLVGTAGSSHQLFRE